MKHVWFQKKQTSFLDYKQKYRMGGKVMTKEEQLARFNIIYDKMSAYDKECLDVGMAYKLGGRVGAIYLFGIFIGMLIGAYLW